MTLVTIHKAKTELSKLLARVEAGEEIVIARGDEPIAKLVPLPSAEKKNPPRKPGALAHLRDKLPPISSWTRCPRTTWRHGRENTPFLVTTVSEISSRYAHTSLVVVGQRRSESVCTAGPERW